MPEDYVIVKHVNDELDTTSEAILKDGTVFYWLYFHNTSGNTIYLSFDGGTTWKQIAADKTLEITAPTGKLYLSEPLKGKATAASSTFEMLIIQERSS